MTVAYRLEGAEHGSSDPAIGEVRQSWWLVAAMTFGMAVSAGSIGHYALGGFLKDIVLEYHWTRGGASTGISLFLIGLGIGIPFFGVLVDRWGPARPALASVILFSLSLAAISQAGGEITFLILFAVMGFLAGGTTAVPYSVAITRTFDRRRGLALGIGSAGVGLGGALLPRYTGYLIDTYDWRTGLLGLAVIVPLVAIPAILVGLRGRAAAAPRPRDAPSSARAQPGWRTRPFWIIVGGVFLISASVGSVLVHGIPLLTDRGLDRLAAAAIVSTMASASMVGRVAGGYLMDRFFAPWVSAGFFLLAGVGIAIILLAGSNGILWVGFILVGLTAGAEADIVIYLTTRYLSLASIGRYTGLMITVFTVASAVGVSALGHAFDAFGSYQPGLMACIAGTVAAAVVIMRLGPYPAAAGDGDISATPS